MGNNALQVLPEGERNVKHLEGHGSIVLVASDQDNSIKGDYLFYDGAWYECTSAVSYKDTILSHYNYQFVLIPKDASGSCDLSEPVGDPCSPSEKGGEAE